MSEYEVSFKKTPPHTRFKPGVPGNPKGRPKRQASPLVEIVVRALGSPIKYREGGRVKSSTYGELLMRMLVDRAAAGDVPASKTLLRAYTQAEKRGDVAAESIIIRNWISGALPDGAKQKEQGPEAASELDTEEPPLPPKSEPAAD